MEFLSGILGSEPPKDGDLGVIAFPLPGLDFPAKSGLVGDATSHKTACSGVLLKGC